MYRVITPSKYSSRGPLCCFYRLAPHPPTPCFRPRPSVHIRAGHDAAAGGLAGACSEKSFPFLAKPFSFGSFLSGPSAPRLRATSSRPPEVGGRAMRGDIRPTGDGCDTSAIWFSLSLSLSLVFLSFPSAVVPIPKSLSSSHVWFVMNGLFGSYVDLGIAWPSPFSVRSPSDSPFLFSLEWSIQTGGYSCATRHHCRLHHEQSSGKVADRLSVVCFGKPQKTSLSLSF